MAVQLPTVALGPAVGVLLWSFLCLASSVLMVWLTWVHRERTSYIALFTYFTGIATCASIAQQLHTIIRYRDLKIEQYDYSVAHITEPEMAVTSVPPGLNLVFFYIQFYCYNVEALLVLIWATSLAQATYQIRRFNLLGSRATNAAKVVSTLLPILFICLLRVDTVRHSPTAFLITANFLMAFGTVLAMATLLAVLGKYVHSRIHLTTCHFAYGSRSATTLTDDETRRVPVEKRNIYDRWLLFRFSIALLAMSAFEVFVICFQLSSWHRNQGIKLGDGPDFSVEMAHLDILQFMAGVSPGLLAFLVFGTTKAFREYMWETIVPRFVKRRLQRREKIVYELSDRC